MAQSQQQQQFPMPGPYSPPATSPAQQYQINSNKRQRLSPNPSSHPGSPSPYSPYAMSPTTGSSTASPHFSNVAIPQGAYTTPYSTGPPNGINGHTTTQPMNLTMPQQSNHQHPQYSQHNQHPPHQQMQNSLTFPNTVQGGHLGHPNQHSTYNSFAPMSNPHGTMGPPLKPVEKPKEDGADPMDVLGGTGVDLREEEQYTFSMYNSSFNSQLTGSQSGTISSGHSFTQFPPGDEASFYGAGPANVAAEKVNTTSQDEYHKKVADKAWQDAAHNLGVSRQKELNNPFLQVHQLQKKMEKITREHGLTLNMDSKGTMGFFKLPQHFPQKEVRVSTAIGPDGALVHTSGQFVPADSMLVDQVALLSIATKHRLRGLLGDAAKLAKGRQTGSHGIIPDEWTDVAVPSDLAGSSIALEGGLRYGWESAVSPNPRKRSHSTTNLDSTPNPSSKITNDLVTVLRAAATGEQDLEEARHKRRLARAGGNVEGATPRQGSVAPGTPGSVAPESTEKLPSKKDMAKKKSEANKVSDIANHAAANSTTAQFLGGKSLFGKKKGGYSWLSGSASGTSTPGRINTQGLPGTPTASGPPPVAKYTIDGVRRLGTWREDREKGRDIQMRDWTAVLEADGGAKKTLQKALLFLDQSEPK